MYHYDPNSPVLQAASEHLGAECHITRPLEGGWNNGAVLVTAGSEDLVLKTHGQRTFDEMSAIRKYCTAARAAGWPTPEWVALDRLTDGTIWSLQEFISGEPLRTLDERAAVAILEANEKQTGLAHLTSSGVPLIDRSTLPVTMLIEDRWSTLADVSGFSKSAAKLVDRLKTVGAYSTTLPGEDLVHGDYNQANIVLRNNRVSGFVDTDEIGIGARAFDLTDLYHRSLLSGDAPRARALLREAVTAQVGAEGFEQCFATTAIGNLRWMTERMPDRVEARIEMLHQELDGTGFGLS